MTVSANDSIHLLHVDDDPDFADFTSTMLEETAEQFTVETATSASAGLDKLAGGTYDCIVSDYEMPEMDGIEFLTAVREQYPELPFVLFTGKGSEEVASEAISAGVTDYLQKEAGRNQYMVLANRVRNAVEQYRATQRARKREQDFKREHDRLSALFENFPEPAFAYVFEDDEPYITRVNGAFTETFGYEPETAVGEHVHELLVPPDDRERAQRISSRVQEGASVDEILRRETDDGVRDFWFRNIRVPDDKNDIDGFAIYVDLTDRKERERELERYKTVIQGSGDPVYTLNADGEFTVVNDAFCEMTGYEESDILGAHFASLLAQSDRHRGEEVVRSVWDPDTDRRTSELTIVRQDGTQIPCEIHITPLPTSETSDFRGNVGVIRDISDRKAREQELQRQRDRLAAVFDAVPHAITEVEFQDGEPIVQQVNDAFEDTFGYSRERVIEEPLTEFILPEEQRGDGAALNQSATDQLAVESEIERITADGQRRTFLFRASRVSEDDPTHWLGTYIDITERKDRERQVRQQREQLQQREEKLIRLRDYTQELMYTETAPETVNIALQAVDEILGFDLGAVFTKSDTQDGTLELVEVLNRRRMEKMYGGLPTFFRDSPFGTHSALAWEVLETGESVFINDTAESDKLTRQSPFGSLMMYPIGGHGVILLAATTLEAFTETDELLLDLLANTLKTAFDRLDRERELRRQRDALEQQNERLDEFASVVSHDLRNPLNTLVQSLSLIETDDDEHLDRCRRSADRMDQLIHDLLTLARQGETSSDPEPVHLREVARDCWQTVEPSDLSLSVETDLTVEADEGRLKQLFENLFRNAIDHGGSVEKLTVGSVEDGFYVTDDGTGIPPTEQAKVFDSGYSTKQGSTGFGLSIVKQIVEAHDWDIHVTESDAGGARFEITGVTTVEW